VTEVTTLISKQCPPSFGSFVEWIRVGWGLQDIDKPPEREQLLVAIAL
jgi:hypothetical protein